MLLTTFVNVVNSILKCRKQHFNRAQVHIATDIVRCRNTASYFAVLEAVAGADFVVQSIWPVLHAGGFARIKGGQSSYARLQHRNPKHRTDCGCLVQRVQSTDMANEESRMVRLSAGNVCDTNH